MDIQLLAYRAALVLAVLVTPWISSVVLNFIKSNIVDKTKTNLDDFLLKELERPLQALFTLAVLYKVITLLRPDLLSDLLKNVFTSLGIILLAFVASGLLKAFIDWCSGNAVAKGDDVLGRQVLPMADVIGKAFIFVLGVTLVLGRFGIDVGPILASLGIAGLAMALALQDTLKNFVAGLHILMDKPVKAGEHISLGSGVEGFVDQIGWRTTRLKSMDGHYVVVPNSRLLETTVFNYSPRFDPRLNCILSFNMNPAVNLNEIEPILRGVLTAYKRESSLVVAASEPEIRYELNEMSFLVRLIVQVRRYEDLFRVRTELSRRVLNAIGKEILVKK